MSACVCGFFELKVETELFLIEKNLLRLLLLNTECFWKLALVDLGLLLNEFNLKLHGEQRLYTKLLLWQSHFNDNEPCLKQSNVRLLYILSMLSKVRTSEISVLTQICSGYVSKAQTKVPAAFFRPLCKHKGNFLISNPLNCTFQELPHKLRMEVINLQRNDLLKANIKRRL